MTSARLAKLGLAGLMGLALAGGPVAHAAETKPPVSASKRWESEFSTWQKVSASSDPAGYEAYLKQYPNGTFASMARLRLAELNARGVAKTAGSDAAGQQDVTVTASEKEKEETARKAAEAERLKAEQDAKVAAEKARAEEERLAAEAERKREAEAAEQRRQAQAQAQARAQAEAQRAAAVKAEQERQAAEAERKRVAEAAEADRLEAEKAARAEQARMKAEQEAKVAAEARAKAEAAAAAQARAEADRAGAEAERERAQAAAEAERARAEQEARTAAEAQARADAAAADKARAEAEEARAEAEGRRAQQAAAGQAPAAEVQGGEPRANGTLHSGTRANGAEDNGTRDNGTQANGTEGDVAPGNVAQGGGADALDTEALPIGPEAGPAAAAETGSQAKAATDKADGTDVDPAEAERLARREDNSWSRAVLNGRQEAFEKYLQEFPDGRFAEQARQRLAGIDVNPDSSGTPGGNGSTVSADTGNEGVADQAARAPSDRGGVNGEPMATEPEARTALTGEPAAREAVAPAPDVMEPAASAAAGQMQGPRPNVYRTPADVREAYLDPGARAQSQRWLNALGYGTGGADGVYGPRTRGAIAAWQRSVGHAADGYLTRRQYRELRQTARFAEARDRDRVARQRYQRDRYYNDGYGVYEGPVGGYPEGPVEVYPEGPVGGYYDGPAYQGDLTISGPGY